MKVHLMQILEKNLDASIEEFKWILFYVKSGVLNVTVQLWV